MLRFLELDQVLPGDASEELTELVMREASLASGATNARGDQWQRSESEPLADLLGRFLRGLHVANSYYVARYVSRVNY